MAGLGRKRREWNVGTPIFDRPPFFHRSALGQPKMEKRTTDLDTLQFCGCRLASLIPSRRRYPQPSPHQPALLQPASNSSPLTAPKGVAREGEVILKPREMRRSYRRVRPRSGGKLPVLGY